MVQDMELPSRRATSGPHGSGDAFSDRRTLDVEVLVALVHLMPAAVMIWDCNGVTDPADVRLVFVSRTAESLLGIDPAGIGGRLAELAPDLPAEQAAATVELSWRGGVHERGDILYQPPGRHPILSRSLIVGLGGGFAASLYEDVTHERALEQDRLELLRRLVMIGDQERRRLAMSLHDGVVQELAGAALLVEATARHAPRDEQRARLDEVARAVRAAAEHLGRVQFELSPPELAESDLQSGIRSAVDVVLRGAIEADVDVRIAVEPPDLISTAAVRIVVDALGHVLRRDGVHRLSVTVVGTPEELTVEVADDGRPARRAVGDVAGDLQVVVDRVSALGGRCELQASGARGPLLQATLPLNLATP